MIDSALLALYALLVASLGARLLTRQSWLERYPRIGIAVWLAALWSGLTAVTFAAGLLALDSFPVRDVLADLIRACVVSLHKHYSELPWSALVGILVFLVATSWIAYHAAQETVRVRRLRFRHRQVLNILGAEQGNPGITLLDHPTSSVYCLPGRGGRIVITAAACRALTPQQLDAVVAHERAHLAGRHHLVTGLTGCLRAALPFVPLVRQAQESIAFLIERTADERACKDFARETLASAMLAMGSVVAPEEALGVGGRSVVRRAYLLTGRRGRTPHVAFLGMVITAGLLVAPLVLATSPAVGLDWQNNCLITPEA